MSHKCDFSCNHDDEPAMKAASQRLIPDAECAQSKCGCTTTGCWGECSLKRNPVVFAMNTASQTDEEKDCRRTCEVCMDELGVEWPCAMLRGKKRASLAAPVSQGSDPQPRDCMGQCPVCRAPGVDQGSATSGEARPALNLNAFQSYENYAIYRAEIERLHAALAASAEQSNSAGSAGVVDKLKALTCAAHPAGYTAKEARMFNIGFYAGVAKAIVEVNSATPVAERAAANKPCDHVWPEAAGQTNIEGRCTKCGMSFQHYTHSEMP